jgi:hypothetical protein
MVEKDGDGSGVRRFRPDAGSVRRDFADLRKDPAGRGKKAARSEKNGRS